MDQHNNPSPDPSSGGSSESTQSRRRFLKGTTLALPAVVTLHSGAAQAATSIACSNVPPPKYTKVCEDNYPCQDNCMRVKVKCYKKMEWKKKNGNWKWVISETDTTPKYFQGKDADGKSVWRYVADGKCVPNNPPTASNGPCYELSGVQNCYADQKFYCGESKDKYAICHVSLQTGYIKAVGTPCEDYDKIPGCIVTSWQGACIASIIGQKTI